MYEDLGSDGLMTCLRCADQDALTSQEICFSCQRELEASHDHEMGWRKAYELELDDELRQQIKTNPNIITEYRDDFNRLIREYKDDPEFLGAIDKGRVKFEERLARVKPAGAHAGDVVAQRGQGE